jgi:hypothetical protein
VEKSTEAEFQIETAQEITVDSTNTSGVVAQAELEGELSAPVGGVKNFAHNDAVDLRAESNEPATMPSVMSGHDTSLQLSLESSPEVQISAENGDISGNATADEPAETHPPSSLENNQIDEPQLSTLSQKIDSNADSIQLVVSTLATFEGHQDGDSSEDSDGGEWITPSNLKKKQLEDANPASTKTPEPKVMQAVSTLDPL